MTIRCAKYLLTLLAILGTPMGMAATVTITASTLTPSVNDTFTITITADVPNTFAGTMDLSFDPTKVAFLQANTGVLTGAGGTSVGTAPWLLIKNSAANVTPTVLNVEQPSSTGADPGDYQIATLVFTALAEGSANIVLSDDGGVTSGWFDDTNFEYIPVAFIQADVEVTAGPAPMIAVTDSAAPADDLELPFGQVTEGVTSAPQTITVKNTGTADLDIGLVTALAPPFALAAPENCSGATLEPDESCTLTVDFTPASSGDFSGTLDIPSNVPTVTVLVSGTGTPMPVGNAVITDSVVPFTDSQIPFGSVTQNLSAIQTVTVTNDGNASLTLGQIAMANSLAAPFSIGTDTCSNQIVAPAGTCSFQVLFEPTATGPFNDTLDVPSDDPDQPTVTVSVTGTGVAVPVGDISVTDSVSPSGDLQVVYGNVGLGSSVNQTITVSNAGTGNLVIGTVGSGNSLAAPFTVVSTTCSGQTLAPAAACTIVVAFAPGAEQPYNDSFGIPSDDPDEATVTVAVTGTGTAAPVTSGGGGSSAIDPATALALGLLAAAGRRRATALRP